MKYLDKMSETALCRLCIRFYNEFINLFDEKGQTTEAYKIAMIYFEPKLLKPQQGHDLTLICIPCWINISNFYNFQQTVNNAQIKLEDEESSVEPITIISIEETDENDPITMPSTIEADIKYSFSIAEGKTIIDLNSNVAIPKLYNNQMLNTKKCFENESNNNSSYSINSLPCPNIHKAMEYDAIIHKWKSVLECDICRSKLCGYYFLRQHFYQNHPNEKFYVICCRRKFRSRFELVEHIRVHMNQNTFQCKICGKSFSCNRNLTRHIREVHVGKMACIAKHSKNVYNIVENKTYFLNIKPKLKTTNNKLNRRLKLQKPSYQNKQKLVSNSEHKYAANLELNRNLIVSKYRRPFKTLSLKLRNSMDYDALIADVKNELECPICNIIITRFSLLCEHFENEHPLKKFHILCCQRQFHNGYQIFKHFQLHMDPNAYTCNICDSTFSRRAYLVRHTRTLHSEKVRWFCDQCDAELKSCSGLNRHKKRCDKVVKKTGGHQDHNLFEQVIGTKW